MTMKKPLISIVFILVALGCSSDDTPLEQPDQSIAPKEQLEDTDSATSDTDSDADSGSDSDSDQSNGPDFDSSTNTVLLTQRAYAYPNGVETEVEYTERVAVVSLTGSSHKVYEVNGAFYIIQLDENNNVVYTEGDRNSFFMTSHNEMPQLVTSNIQSDVPLNIQVYYSNDQMPKHRKRPRKYMSSYGIMGTMEK